MRSLTMWVAMPVLAGVLCAAAQAQSLPRLPDGIRLARSADSPGQVTFFHESHVDPSKPTCTACHSQQFNILKASGRKPISHDSFEKGRQCGACHDGKKAFKVEDDCANCHRS